MRCFGDNFLSTHVISQFLHLKSCLIYIKSLQSWETIEGMGRVFVKYSFDITRLRGGGGGESQAVY